MKQKLLIIIAALMLCGAVTGTAAERQAGLTINSRYDYGKATGNAGRATDVGFMTGTVTATRRLGDNFAVSLSGGGVQYRFPSNGSLFSRIAGMSFDYRGAGAEWGAGYVRQSAAGRMPARETYTLYSLITMLPHVGLGLSYGRDNRINSADVATSNLGDHYLNASLTYTVNPLLSFACDFKKADVSDGNTYQVQGLQSKLTFSKTPSLYALFRVERQMYATISSRYFSPADYVSFSGTLAYKRDICIPGVKDMSYELALEAAGDSNSEVSFHPRIAVTADVGKNIGVNASYAQTFSPAYKDSNVSVSFTWHP